MLSESIVWKNSGKWGQGGRKGQFVEGWYAILRSLVGELCWPKNRSNSTNGSGTTGISTCKRMKLGKTVWWFLNKLNIELPYNPAIPLLGNTQKNWKQGLKQIFVHQCSQQHYSQSLNGETTQVFINRWIDKQNVVYTYNRIQPRKDTCYNMDEPWKHCAKWKSQTQRTNIVWFHLHEISRQIHRDSK